MKSPPDGPARDGRWGWPHICYRADHQRWCQQVPTASEWCRNERGGFRDNGGYEIEEAA
jgi:hypothetical protein